MRAKLYKKKKKKSTKSLQCPDNIWDEHLTVQLDNMTVTSNLMLILCKF